VKRRRRDICEKRSAAALACMKGGRGEEKRMIE
jgi:hypothetical protein